MRPWRIRLLARCLDVSAESEPRLGTIALYAALGPWVGSLAAWAVNVLAGAPTAVAGAAGVVAGLVIPVGYVLTRRYERADVVAAIACTVAAAVAYMLVLGVLGLVLLPES